MIVTITSQNIVSSTVTCSGVTTTGAGRAVAPPLFDGSTSKIRN